MNRMKVLRGLALALTLGGIAGWWFHGRGEPRRDLSISALLLEESSRGSMGENKPEGRIHSDEPTVSDPLTTQIGSQTTVRTAGGVVSNTQSVPSPSTLTTREAANAFRHGQNNAFFDEAAFLGSFSSNDGQGIENLRKELRSTDALAALPEDVDFFKDAPEAVLDRMAMIDMLGMVAKDDSKALDALAEIATQQIDTSLPPHVIRALVGEKYDAFVELARHDWKVASSAFSALNNDKLKEAMRPALMSGLVDSGTPNDEALRMVQAI